MKKTTPPVEVVELVGKFSTIGRTKNMAKDMPDMKFFSKGGFIAKGCGQVENSRRKRTRNIFNGCTHVKKKAGLALKRWFKEDWKDVRTGKACGRRKGEKRGTPYCRPSKRVSSKTPRTAGEMSSSEKAKRVAQKKRLGQPAGKPRRVEAVRRKKRGTKKR